MKKRAFITTIICLCFFNCFSQNNVRAWYADGQVFVVWEVDLPFEETYTIFASENSFENTDDAFLVGRPFALEYSGFALKDNLQDTTATYRIPADEDNYYQLAPNEGLFVYTPHQSGSLYFAVTRVGVKEIIADDNITDAIVSFDYDPENDPVECHLQRTFPSPFDSDFVCFAYCMWADGRQNHWEGRPDFPIMANAAKNGMPGLFLISVPEDLDNSLDHPMSIWLHGGGGRARQSLAGSRNEIGIDPSLGILVAHNDRLHGYRGETPANPDQPSWHFGWSKNYNPFTPNFQSTDTIINYTQRKYLWIDEWLSNNFNIDTDRINSHGHSMGSAGALALAKCYPAHYGSATLFNTGCGGPIDESNISFIFGSLSDNYPTNLKNINGEAVRLYDLWDLYTNCSARRDLPLIKHWHGKHDDNGTMRWSPLVVENYKICDSIGTGVQNYWSERSHGVNLAPDFNDHWIMGATFAQQTANDNVNFAEAFHRSDVSFPAFFNHRLDPKNNDPGTGLIGIDNGDGDNWGTWGGYHRWGDVVESTQDWWTIAWLEGDANYPNDNCPSTSLTADLAIRRPQEFKPSAGETVYWSVFDFVSQTILQSDSSIVRSDNLVVIPQVEIFKESIRGVVIFISLSPTSTENVTSETSRIQIVPNPSSDFIHTNKNWAEISIIDLNGNEVKHEKVKSSNEILDISYLPAGVYFLNVLTNENKRKVGKLVKL